MTEREREREAMLFDRFVRAMLAVPRVLEQPAFAQRMEGEFKNPQYNEEPPTSDLTYLLLFTAALLFYIGKTAFDKSGAKSLGDAVNK